MSAGRLPGLRWPREIRAAFDYSLHLGPLIARNQAAASALLAAVLGEDAPWRSALNRSVDSDVEVRASVPGVADENLAFYRSVGLELDEDDVLMQLDLGARAPTDVRGPEVSKRRELSSPLPPYPGEPRYVYAWLAPMCF